MSFFEVTVPGARGKGFDDLMQIEAPNWRGAYARALSQYGQSPDLRGAWVSVESDAVRVTDPVGRRVVRIRPLAEAEARVSQAVAAPVPAPAPPLAQSGQVRAVGFTNKATGMFKPIGASEITAARGQATSPDGEGRILQQASVPAAAPAADDGTTERIPDGAEQVRARLDSRSSVAALEDVFLEIPRLFDEAIAMEDAIDFVIDLAMKHVPSEHAVMLFASDMADHLYVAAARGAREKALVDAQLSIHEGIPAESLRNGVTLGLVDPTRDARYRPELRTWGISESSLVAAPIQHGERAFGVLLMVNRVGASHYASDDSNVVAYIGLQMGKFIEQQLDSAPLE